MWPVPSLVAEYRSHTQVNQGYYKPWGKGFTVSQSALEQAVQDIRHGITYPDFWTDRYEDDEQTEQGKEEKEEKKAA